MAHLLPALQPALENKLVRLRGDLAVVGEAQRHSRQSGERGGLQKGGGGGRQGDLAVVGEAQRHGRQKGER